MPAARPSHNGRTRRYGDVPIAPLGLDRYGRLRLGREEALNEVQRDLRDLLPAMIDRQRMSPSRDLLDFGDAGIALLLVVRGVRD